MATFFISDLHLRADRPATNRILFDFLAGPARQARALYVLGDLFEYWAGDDDLADPFNREVCSHLARLSDAGVRLFFMAGNRDFLAGEGFAAATGATLLPDPTLATIEGRRALLMHGDTLCADDLAYQAYRRTVRDAAWQQAFLAKPLPERKNIIAGLRECSESAKRDKPADIMDANADAVAQALRCHGYPLLIHGHTHRPARHEHLVDGRRCQRWVLPDWHDSGGALLVTADAVQPIQVPVSRPFA
ncbi:MAG: UDP-2,3-diacylglucosamine diphosphatase [Pseudomonadota bacterium]